MNYLELHRRKRNLTIPEAAKIVGVSTATWHHYEHPRTSYWKGRKPYPAIRQAFESWAGVSWKALMQEVR